MKGADHACLIDASIYIFRAWFSLPDNWYSPAGQPLNAVYGYSKFLLDFLQQAGQPRYCAAAFDESLGTCYRNDIYADYKASRELPDDALAFQLQTCRKITALLGIPCFGGPRYEADDYLASLAWLLRRDAVPVTIVTRDKDLGQLLLSPGDAWWDFSAGLVLDAAGFQRKFAVQPQQFADYLALVGDPVDDIPGVPGVGAKTAARLLQQFPSLDALEAGLEQVAELDIRGATRVQQRLREHWPQVRLARQLTGLEERIPELDKLSPFTLRHQDVQQVADYLTELGIGGPLLRRYQQLAQSLEAA